MEERTLEKARPSLEKSASGSMRAVGDMPGPHIQVFRAPISMLVLNVWKRNSAPSETSLDSQVVSF